MDDELLAGFGLIERDFQERQQFRKQWHDASFSALMLLRFGAVNDETLLVPKNVLPAQEKMLGRASQTAVAAQCDDQLR